MNWSMYHIKSQEYSSSAEEFFRNKELDRAFEYYQLAAEEETHALEELDQSKARTYSITVVSAASLWYKCHQYQKALKIAYKGLGNEYLMPFAIDELKELIQYIWVEQSQENAGIKFTEGEVIVSVSGGNVVKGGAPLELILRKVDEVEKYFYRTIEFLLNQPLRKHGAPDFDIQQQFRPWLFQAPTGSYQFEVKVQRPDQMTLFPDMLPQVDQITHKFMQIIKASIDDPTGELIYIVPNPEYRDTFLKLTRNLAPTGKLFEKLEIKSPSDRDLRSILLVPSSREIINQTIKKPIAEEAKKARETIKKLKGVLRGLQLDHDWLDIDEEDNEGKTTRIYQAGEAIDDVVGPMVNHRVEVDVAIRANGTFAFRDIQIEE